MKQRMIVYLKSLNGIPKFKSEAEEAKFWDAHSVAKIIDQLEPINVTLSSALKNQIFKAALTKANAKYSRMLKRLADVGETDQKET